MTANTATNNRSKHGTHAFAAISDCQHLHCSQTATTLQTFAKNAQLDNSFFHNSQMPSASHSLKQ